MRERRWLNGVPKRSHFLASVIDAVDPVRVMILSDLRVLFYETFGQMPGAFVARGDIEDAILYQAQADAYELAEIQMPERVALACREAIDRAKLKGNSEMVKKSALLEKLDTASKKPTTAPKKEKKGAVNKGAAPEKKAPRKKRTAEPIDDLAAVLSGMDVSALVILAKNLGLKDVDRYKKLPNAGLARMTVGNRIRGFVRRGEISITKVKAAVKAVK